MTDTAQFTPDEVDDKLKPEEFTAEFAEWAKVAPTDELVLMLAGISAELLTRGAHPSQQPAPPVDNDKVAVPLFTPEEVAKIAETPAAPAPTAAAPAPAKAAAPAPAAPAAPARHWSEDQ